MPFYLIAVPFYLTAVPFYLGTYRNLQKLPLFPSSIFYIINLFTLSSFSLGRATSPENLRSGRLRACEALHFGGSRPKLFMSCVINQGYPWLQTPVNFRGYLRHPASGDNQKKRGLRPQFMSHDMNRGDPWLEIPVNRGIHLGHVTGDDSQKKRPEASIHVTWH